MSVIRQQQWEEVGETAGPSKVEAQTLRYVSWWSLSDISLMGWDDKTFSCCCFDRSQISLAGVLKQFTPSPVWSGARVNCLSLRTPTLLRSTRSEMEPLENSACHSCGKDKHKNKQSRINSWFLSHCGYIKHKLWFWSWGLGTMTVFFFISWTVS